MNRRNFLTFLGIGAIGAATCIEPPGPALDPEKAVVLPEDMRRMPGYVEPKMFYLSQQHDMLRVQWAAPDLEFKAWGKPVGKEVW